jgi:tetratricopeptide (TPR) repeat protein
MEAALSVRENAADHLEYLSSLKDWQEKTLDKKQQPKPTVNKDAILLKEKGNEFFKLSKYKESIMYYSKALKATGHRLDIVFLNRAQAYLKIDEWKRAEQDCSDYIQACGDRNLKVRLDF